MNIKITVLIFILISIAFVPVPRAENASDFDQWLKGLRAEARERGVSEATLDSALKDVKPIPRVIELDRKQPEFTMTLSGYLERQLSDTRIKKGRRMLRKHSDLLEKVHQRHGVQPRFLVAIWGLESNYGSHTGSFPIIDSLVTLAYDPRRSGFFRRQLLEALAILDAGHITVSEMKGSWAGAMGQVQFMPSTFTTYAADGDGDGRKDIWNNLADAFESAANFLSRSGWDGERTWGREVLLPRGFDRSAEGLEIEKPLARWQEMGVRRLNGDDLPKVDIDASLIMPAGEDGPAYLVYQNYRTILRWNRSHLYALAVGKLADRLSVR